MREAEFKAWFEAQDYSGNTINTQLSKVRKLDRVFGDLDQLHAAGQFDELEARLKSGQDLPEALGNDGERDHLPTSLRYYRRFLEGDVRSGNNREHASLVGALSAADIEATMDDCDEAGVDDFLREYGYARPSNWVIRPSNGQRYPAKAIIGIAIGKLPGESPQRAGEFFSGFGESQSYSRLRELGYTIVGREEALVAENKPSRQDVETAMDEWDTLGERAFLAKYSGSLQGARYYAVRGSTRYASKALANAAYQRRFDVVRKYKGSEARKLLAALGYTIVDSGAGYIDEDADDAAIAYSETAPQPTNLILYGPPGTGKTYRTAREAVRLCDGIADFPHTPEGRDALLTRYRELENEKQIAFVTFHQNYDYESFVEGLRPETGGDDASAGFRLEPRAGIFREICALADQARTRPRAQTGETGLDLSGRRFWKMGQGAIGSEDDVYEEALANGYIALGWGGTIDWSPPRFSSFEAIKAEWTEQNPDDPTPSNWTQTYPFRCEMKPGDIVIVPYGNTAFRAVAEVTGDYYFVPSAEGYYAHRRPVRWLLTLDDPLPLDTIVDGKFTMRTLYPLLGKRVNVPALARLFDGEARQDGGAESPGRPDQFVLIIDEINRANISKVFGELITLLEPDKRLGRRNALTVTLPYSKKKDFGVPENLHIVGTMNTADRSIALLDTALRRRFVFRELAPDPSLLDEDVGGVPLRRVLMKINDRIEYLIDREHRIGHAFFIDCKDRPDIDAVMHDKVIPLLQEYFFEDWGRVAAVLGERPERAGAFLDCRKLPDPTGNDGVPRPSWSVRREFADDAYSKLLRDAQPEASEEPEA